jgi:hypothetical protein
MKNKLFSLSGFSFIVAVLLLSLTVNINAQDHKGQEKQKKSNVVGKDNYKDVSVRDKHYYYREGSFYDKRDNGYSKIDAPIDARISALPHGYKTIRSHKTKYYSFGGIYYKFSPSEKVYVVVKAPL